MAAATLFCVADRSDAEEGVPQPPGSPERPVAGELELLKRRIEELETAKRAHEDAAKTLNQRLKELEEAKLAHGRATRMLKQRLENLETAKIVRDDATPGDETGTLKQRIEELEKAKLAHEDATRTIIRQSFAERGSTINDYVDFGGTIETLAFRTEDFTGVRESNILFDTADLDFKIRVSDWALGSLILSHEPGTDVIFPTTTGGEASVDRISVREAFVTLGNTERFPLFATAGRLVVPFGISTGDPVTDALTLVDPLTVEVFEAREDMVMFGFELPTPAPPPPLAATPVPIPALVKPLLLRPLVRTFSTWLCSYLSCYPPPPKPVLPTIPPAGLAPFTAAVYLYNGDTFDPGGDHIENMGATLGYRTRGMLSGPRIGWSIDVDVDINSSVFDSDFLQFEYQPFLNQIGYVAGMAAHLKGNFGPIGLLSEWNRAIDDAAFTDEALQLDPESGALNVVPGKAIGIRPGAWQVQLSYQFDYNPSVEAIGAQGTYLVVGYSESQDLAGVTRVDPSTLTPTRVGFVPERRLSVGVGEWVLETLRVAVEYSRAWDYSIGEGGTGRSTDGFFMQLTYEW
ncbi:MAG: hypothetical protein ACREX4_00520 [Gammaproteobacteria bacterium]